MEMEVLNASHISFPYHLFTAGLHISPSDILDKEIGLGNNISFHATVKLKSINMINYGSIISIM